MQSELYTDYWKKAKSIQLNIKKQVFESLKIIFLKQGWFIGDTIVDC